MRGPALAASPASIVFLAFSAVLAASLLSPLPLHAAEGRAQVRLVRLLAEVPDSDRVVLGKLHDLRLRLERGNVLILRKGGDFAALLPIERTGADRDSLRYFFYVEHPNFLWLIPGQRDKGIAAVADGGDLKFNAFRLRWRSSADGLGWVYFPDDESNRNLSFSVVSGGTVDEADPRHTKYWIELGPPGPGGF